MSGTREETIAQADLAEYRKSRLGPGQTKYEDAGNDLYGELKPFSFEASIFLDDIITFNDILGTNRVRSDGSDASRVSLYRSQVRIRKKAMAAAAKGGVSVAQT